jgi:hypothetical protein
MLKVNQEEKERILKLHESKNSKNLLSEQDAADRFVDNRARQYLQNANNTTTSTSSKPKLEFRDVQSELTAAFRRWGTDVNRALEAFKRANPAHFDDIIRRLYDENTKIATYNGLIAALNGEYGHRNKVDLDNINKVFVDNNSQYILGYDVRGTRSVKNIRLDPNPNYKRPQAIPTQTTAQRKPQPSTGNRSVSTEVQNITKQIQKALSMKETGTMDQATINKAYEIISKL